MCHFYPRTLGQRALSDPQPPPRSLPYAVTFSCPSDGPVDATAGLTAPIRAFSEGSGANSVIFCLILSWRPLMTCQRRGRGISVNVSFLS
jgi:hypothetical protein